MDAFRCTSLVDYDFKNYIEMFLSELEYDERFSTQNIAILSKKLLLLFQMMSYSMDDKLFIHERNINLQGVSNFLKETWTFRLDYSTITIYLKRILEVIKSSRTKENMHEMIFSVFYS